MVDGETSSAASSEELVIELPEELEDRGTRGLSCMQTFFLDRFKDSLDRFKGSRSRHWQGRVTGGAKTYSPGSLEFRATYVSLLLFRGSYVWVKFRNRGGNKAREGYLHLRKKTSSTEPRWEPRYSPLGKGRLSLGQYAKKDDAEVVLHVAQYYFERRKLKVVLGDCFEYSIPDTIVPEDHGNFEEERIRVRSKVREVLQHYKTEKKKYKLGIQADEILHDLPNLQNEDIEAEQQRHAFETQLLLEEENFNLKVQIAEYDISREKLIQHLRSDNAELGSMLGQLKTTHECSRNRGFE